MNLKEARATREAVRDGDPPDELCRYFASALFKEHIRQYHRRPVYWLLQSSRHTYGVWLFHERPDPPACFARLKLWKTARLIVLQYGQTLVRCAANWELIGRNTTQARSPKNS